MTASYLIADSAEPASFDELIMSALSGRQVATDKAERENDHV